MNTSQAGNLSQSKVIVRLVELGYSVFVPFGDGEKVDLIFIEEGRCVKSQTKTGRLKDGFIEFNCYSQTRDKQRMYYDDIIDVFMVYCPQLDAVYRVPVEAVAKNFGRLRTTQSKTRQDSRYASDFEL